MSNTQIWAMERGALRAFRQAVAIAPRSSSSAPPKSFSYVGDVAVLDVTGVILQSDSYLNRFYSEYLGGCITERLSVQFTDAMRDTAISSILLRVNSPGGEAAGMDSFSEKIFKARGSKPIVAHVDGLNCSGAYFFSSACDSIFSTRDSTHGNIGTVCSIYNVDAALEKAGIEEIEIVSNVSPNKRPNETTTEGRALYQEWIDALGQSFVDAVARNRGISSADVVSNYGQGWVKVGNDALNAGMIDGLGSLEDVLRSLLRGETTAQMRAGFTPAGARSPIAQPSNFGAFSQNEPSKDPTMEDMKAQFALIGSHRI